MSCYLERGITSSSRDRSEHPRERNNCANVPPTVKYTGDNIKARRRCSNEIIITSSYDDVSLVSSRYSLGSGSDICIIVLSPRWVR